MRRPRAWGVCVGKRFHPVGDRPRSLVICIVISVHGDRNVLKARIIFVVERPRSIKRSIVLAIRKYTPDVFRVRIPLMHVQEALGRRHQGAELDSVE